MFYCVAAKKCMMFDTPLPEVLGPVSRWKEKLHCVLIITLDSMQYSEVTTAVISTNHNKAQSSRIKLKYDNR